MSFEQLLGALLAFLSPAIEPTERVYAGFLVSSIAIAALVFASSRKSASASSVRRFFEFLFPKSVWLHRSALLDYQLVVIRPLLRAVLIAPLAVQSLTVMALVTALFEAAFGASPQLEWPRAAVGIVYTILVFVADDATRYWLHRAMHRVAWLWQLHKAHHSAEVLTPLTLYRTHPVETLLYTYRGSVSVGVATGIAFYLFRGYLNAIDVLGVNLLGFAFNAAGANLRHSHIWCSFGRRVERWIISPAQHQIHHSRDPRHHDRNFGSFLAVWDRMGGTLYVPAERETLHFGLAEGERVHQQNVVSFLFSPLVTALRAARGRT